MLFWTRRTFHSSRFHPNKMNLSKGEQCSEQCDRMAGLFVQIFAIYSIKNCPKLQFFAKRAKCKIDPQKLLKTIKIVPKWRHFAKSGHTGLLT